MMKKFAASLAALAMVVSILPVRQAEAAVFTDQDQIPSWASEYVSQLVADGVISGYSDGRFGPNDALTRAQFAKIAVLAAGVPAEATVSDSGFPDVPAAHWAAPYVKAAKDNGIIGGYANGSFGPNDQVTRAQAAKILVNAFGLSEHTSQGPTFSDVESSAWYYPFVETAYYYSVINGYSDGRFGPNDAVTRAQVAKMTVLAKSPTPRGDSGNNGGNTGGNEVPAGELGVVSAEAKSATTVMVEFSEEVQTSTSENIANYSVEGLEVKGAKRSSDGKSVTLTTSAQTSGKDYTLTVSDVKVAAGDSVIGSVDSVVFIGYVTTVSNASFTVSVSPNTPAAANVPKNANSIPFATWDFTAGSQEDVKISKIVIERTGLSSDDDIDALYLYEGVNRLTDDRTLSNDTHTATFNLAKPIVIAAGTTRSITLTGTFSGAPTNKTFAFQVTFADDVTAVGADTGGKVSVGGDFPLRGNTISVADLTAGTLTLTAGTTSDDTAKVGETQVDFGQIKLQASSVEDVLVTSLAIENKGNSSDDLENVTLYRDDTGEMVASVPVLDDDRAVFDLSAYGDGGVLIEDGQTMRFNVKADVVSANSANDTIDFQVDDQQDVTGIGQTYGYGVAVSAAVFPFDFSTSNVEIKSSDVVFSFTKPEATEVNSDSTDRIIGVLDITNRGEELLVKNMNFALLLSTAGADLTTADTSSAAAATAAGIFANAFDNVKIVDSNGNVVAGPRDAALDTIWKVKFTDDWVIPSSASAQRYFIKADIKDTATNGYTFALAFEPDETAYLEVEGNVTGNAPSTGDISPSVLTASDQMEVQDAQLTLARSSTPTSDIRIAGNTVDSLGVTLTANDSGDVEVRKMKFDLLSGTDMGASSSSGVTASEIVSASLYAEDGTFLDSSSISNATVTFDAFQNKLLVPSGGQVKVIVKTALNSSVTSGRVLAYDIDSSADYVTAIDSEGNTLEDAALLGADSGLNSVSGLTTQAIIEQAGTSNGIFTVVKTSGSLSVTKSDSPITSKQLQLGASGVEVLKLKLQATDENITLKKLRLFVTDENGSGTTAANSLIKSLSLYDGSTLVGQPFGLTNSAKTGMSGTGGYVEWNWTGTSRPVITEGTKELTVKATFNVSDGGVATPGQSFRLALNSGSSHFNGTYDIEAEGSKNTVVPTITANSSTEGANFATGLVSQKMVPYDTLLTVSKATQEVYGRVSAPAGSENYFKFTVAASARPTADTSTQQIQAVLKAVRMKVTGTVKAANFTLYNAADGQKVDRSGDTNGLVANGAHPGVGSTEVLFDMQQASAVQDYKLDAGNSITYYVRADVDSTGAQSDSTKTLAFSFSSFGSKDSTATSSPSYIVWQDVNQNGTDSDNVYWINQADTSLSSGTIEFTSAADNVASAEDYGFANIVHAVAPSSSTIKVYFDRAVAAASGSTTAGAGVAFSALNGTNATISGTGSLLVYVDGTATGYTAAPLVGLDGTASGALTLTIGGSGISSSSVIRLVPTAVAGTGIFAYTANGSGMDTTSNSTGVFVDVTNL